MKRLMRNAVLAAAAVITACSGGGDAALTGGSSGLVVTVVDEARAPLQGVRVVLHAADNIAVERELLTNAQGRVDFGAVDRARVTLTTGRTVFGLVQSLLTHVDVPVGSRLMVLPGDFSGPVGEINASFSVMPGDARSVLLPFGPDDDNLNDGQANFSNVPVLEFARGDSGQLHLLALTQTAGGQINQYGFLLNQPFNDGGTYVGSINRTAVQTGWTADAPDPFITVGAVRDGVPFLLGQRDFETSGPNVLPVMREFPGDFYTGFAVTVDSTEPSGQARGWVRNFDVLPAQIDIDFAEFAVSGLVYDDANRSYTWQQSGAMTDALTLTHFESDDERTTEWTLRLSSARNSLQLPELPPEFQNNPDNSDNSSGGISAGLRAFDHLDVVGYDAFDGSADQPRMRRAALNFDFAITTEQFGDDPPPGGNPSGPLPLPGLPGLP